MKEYIVTEDKIDKKYAAANCEELVRCKECRWWEPKKYGLQGYCYAAKHGHYSRNWEIGIYRLYGPDFYCADGERREDET